MNDITSLSAANGWAVGSYQSASPRRQKPFSAHWDGSTWSVVHVPHKAGTPRVLEDLSAASSDDLWASGAASKYGSDATQSALVEHWDGSSWSYVQPPDPGHGPFLSAVAAVSKNDVWCAGFYYYGPYYGFLAHWDGTSWAFEK